jgi:transcriptional regulator with XRE-family HTH domain
MNRDERSGWGPIVEAKRKELGLTQEELGDRAGGLSAKTVGNVETGRIYAPQEKTLRAILDVLGLSFDRSVALGQLEIRPATMRRHELDTARELWLKALEAEHRDDSTALIEAFRAVVKQLPEQDQWRIFNESLRPRD